ncbi:unnamed protein product [Euphydryas editha]|uniref:Pre-C2HC domain-containing protein n=1 Tax=Euphydryas editha TaxID=104508 RepID=A0AAU9U6Q4_EUPED|nr:unnamed protein product [Euphydryas editha]
MTKNNRGLPAESETEVILDDLKQQDFPIREVHRMYHPKIKAKYNMVLAILDLSTEGKKIFNLLTVCHLSGLAVEPPPRNRGLPGQCHNCQLYGHSARNCFGRPRCVKCLYDHGTKDGPRKVPDPENPPSCVLCKTQGHAATYRWCTKAPRRRAPKRGQPTAARNPPPVTQTTHITPQTASKAPAAPVAPQANPKAPQATIKAP